MQSIDSTTQSLFTYTFVGNQAVALLVYEQSLGCWAVRDHAREHGARASSRDASGIMDGLSLHVHQATGFA